MLCLAREPFEADDIALKFCQRCKKVEGKFAMRGGRINLIVQTVKLCASLLNGGY